MTTDVHLAAIVECEIFRDHRPTVTQLMVKHAIESVGSTVLEQAQDGYHLRLRPEVERKQLDDNCTVYIVWPLSLSFRLMAGRISWLIASVKKEPSTPSLPPRAPGKIALDLSETLLPRLLPVLYTTTTARSYTLVTLSSPVSERDVANSALWPHGWIVLTHKEWTGRTEEYIARKRQATEARLVQPLHEQGETGHKEEKGKEFEPGLILHIERLHNEVNKPSISSFVTRSVDRYLRKKERKSAKKKEVEAWEKEETHNNPKVQINYIDYKKGSDSCYLRQSTAADSELIVAALKARKRAMRDGSDGMGFKEKERFVVGRILEGEEEKLYWQKVHDTISETAAANKGRKEKGKEQAAAETVDVDLRHPGKRPRLSTGSVVVEGKRKKLDISS